MERQDHPTGTVPPGQRPEYAARPDYPTRADGSEGPDRRAAYPAARPWTAESRQQDGTTPADRRRSDEQAAADRPAGPEWTDAPTGREWTDAGAGREWTDRPAGYPPGAAAQPAGSPPPYGPQYGTAPAAEPERPKWSARRTTAVTAVAAAAVLAIGGVAVAHSGDSGATAGTAQGGPGGAGGQGFPGGGTGTGLTGALHGTFVTQATDGSYVTRLMQTGSVTAVSSSSITVKSTDGYAKTYTLSGSTTVNGGQSQVSAIQTGNTVTVVASEAGAATTVTDQSLAGSGQGGFPGGTGQQGGFPGGTGQQGGTGTGTGTGTGGTT